MFIIKKIKSVDAFHIHMYDGAIIEASKARLHAIKVIARSDLDFYSRMCDEIDTFLTEDSTNTKQAPVLLDLMLYVSNSSRHAFEIFSQSVDALAMKK